MTNPPYIYRLRSTIRSYCKKEPVYAVAGTPVKLINDRGKMLIVERPDGFRFSVTADEVIKEPADIAIQKTDRRASKQSPVTTQTNLF